MIRTLILALLGGVRISDALEAVCYERQRPIGSRRDLLSPGANVIWQKADELDRAARLGDPHGPVACDVGYKWQRGPRPAPRTGF